MNDNVNKASTDTDLFRKGPFYLFVRESYGHDGTLEIPVFIVTAEIRANPVRWTRLEMDGEALARAAFRILKLVKPHVAEEILNQLFDEEIGSLIEGN